MVKTLNEMVKYYLRAIIKNIYFTEKHALFEFDNTGSYKTYRG